MKVKEVSEGMNQIAKLFWEMRGAVIGRRQRTRDIDGRESSVTAPIRLLDPDSEFVTDEAVIEPYRRPFSGDNVIQCTLWVRPIRKGGTPGQPIRLYSMTIK